MCFLDDCLAVVLDYYLKRQTDYMHSCNLVHYDLLEGASDDFFVIFDLMRFKTRLLILNKSMKTVLQLSKMEKMNFLHVVKRTIRKFNIHDATLHYRLGTQLGAKDDVRMIAALCVPDIQKFMDIFKVYQHHIPCSLRRFVSHRFNCNHSKLTSLVISKTESWEQKELWRALTQYTNDAGLFSVRLGLYDRLVNSKPIDVYHRRHSSLPIVMFQSNRGLESVPNLCCLLNTIEGVWFRKYSKDLPSCEIEIFVNLASGFRLGEQLTIQAFIQYDVPNQEHVQGLREENRMESYPSTAGYIRRGSAWSQSSECGSF